MRELSAQTTRPLPSLHQLLRQKLLLPLIPILLISIALSYVLAEHAAITAYDAGILDDANDVAQQIELRDGKLVLDLPAAAQQMLAFNNEDPVAYAVWDDAGLLISGDSNLQKAIGSATQKAFRDLQLEGKLYRCAVIHRFINNQHIVVGVAQAVKARTSLVNEVFISMLGLGGVLIIFTIAIVINAVRIGLRPVEQLRDMIAQRSTSDLSAIPETTSPPELQPIIHGTNELLQKLATSFAAYRRFVADAAHQLRTPLAGLGSQLEFNLAHPPEDIPALLRQLLSTTRRASHLANQLLSLARLEHTEKTAIDNREINFLELIQDAASHFITIAARKSVEFEFSIECKTLRGSALLLGEMLSNLLDNAVRYAPEHSTILVSARQDNTATKISICDSGPGVPEHELQKLGTPFHQLSSSAPHGCGLGLAIVREIAHLHGGKVEFANGESGTGFIVTVTLPLQNSVLSAL